MASDYQKWLKKLLGFTFDIKFKPGKNNRVADALSRKSEGEIEFGAMMTEQGMDMEELAKEIEDDLVLQ